MTQYYIKEGRKYIPAKLPELDTDDRILLNCAFRYALGRMSYVVGDIVEQLINAYSVLSIHDKTRIANEIEEAIKEGHAGMNMDVQEWKRVMHLFRPENHCKVKAYFAAENKVVTINREDINKPIEIKVSDKFEIVDAVKMDNRYYSLDMKKYYHTVKELKNE